MDQEFLFIIGGIPLKTGPLEWGLTVVLNHYAHLYWTFLIRAICSQHNTSFCQYFDFSVAAFCFFRSDSLVVSQRSAFRFFASRSRVIALSRFSTIETCFRVSESSLLSERFCRRSVSSSPTPETVEGTIRFEGFATDGYTKLWNRKLSSSAPPFFRSVACFCLRRWMWADSKIHLEWWKGYLDSFTDS